MYIAQALEHAGKSLSLRYGSTIPRWEIVNIVVRLTGCSAASVLPSDHCYNRTNDGIKIPPHNVPLFLWVKQGVYHYVGQNYQYSDKVIRCFKQKV